MSDRSCGRLSVLLQVCRRPPAAGGDPLEDSAGLRAVTSGWRRALSAGAPCRLAAGLFRLLSEVIGSGSLPCLLLFLMERSPFRRGCWPTGTADTLPVLRAAACPQSLRGVHGRGRHTPALQRTRRARRSARACHRLSRASSWAITTPPSREAPEVSWLDSQTRASSVEPAWWCRAATRVQEPAPISRGFSGQE